jgi:hypothetical protein
MHGHTLVNLGQGGRLVNGTVELLRSQRVDRITPRKQPTTIEHLALCACHTPPHTQSLQQDRRNHVVAVLATLALFHPQRHALAVDVAHL